MEEVKKPFLKWAGGKRELVPKIEAALGGFNGRLIEPFAGSAAVSLGIEAKGGYIINDINKDLFTLYTLLARDGRAFISYARRLWEAAGNNERRYYRMRGWFNKCDYGEFRAAAFIYMNKHGFNGLCRYNRQGGYNVPFGSYKTVRFPEEAMIGFHNQFTGCKAVFSYSDFEAVMREAKRGDVVYCDPPYIPLSATAYFTGYAKGGFHPKDQLRLAARARVLAARGIKVVISNSDTPLTWTTYKGATRIESFPVKRTISAKAKSRKPVHELLITYC